jgi:amidohydrolase
MHRGGFGPFSHDAWSAVGPWESRLDAQIDRLEQELVRIRRHLHANPEPSGEEIETSKLVARRLRDLGLAPRICRSDCGNEVGVVADLTLGDSKPDAPLIALRADMDALRIPDEKAVEYRSRRPGIAHACGHDAHTTILLGAALAGAAAQAEQEPTPGGFGARLRFLFQPAEETSGGAHWLVEQGALEGVDAIVGLHVDPERPVGQVGVRYGVLTANCDEVEIVVEGHGGHAARPHHTIDPIAAAAHLVGTLYEFLPRAVDSRSASVFTIGRISGGYTPNVIPERVELLGSLRTTEPHTREMLKKRIEQTCAAVELTSGATVRARFHSPLKSVNNDPMIAHALELASERVVGRENVAIIDRPSMGGEDFAVYLDHVRGALLRLGCATPGVKTPFLHSTEFDIDERALVTGTKILTRAALLLATH